MKIIRQSHHFDRGIFQRDSMGRERADKLPAKHSVKAAERAAYEAFRATIGAVSFTVEEEPA